MRTNLYFSLILLLGACLLEPVKAQTTNPTSGSTVTFHEPKGVQSVSEPPAPLRQITAELSGTLIGRAPNVTIEFVLTLQNTGQQEVKIADPLDSLFLRFATIGNKLITIPERLPKAVMNTKGGKEHIAFPDPVEVRQIVQGTSVRYQKEEIMTIPPGDKIRIVFDTEPVVMDKVNTALQSETGGSARSFKAKASLVLLEAPPLGGGHPLESDWILLTVPALR
jgi:hypothetical protein